MFVYSSKTYKSKNVKYACLLHDTDIDECASQPCIHGECNDQLNGYLCECLEGYTGVHCEIEIDECASGPCVNGDCINHINAFECVCEEGWTGTHCDDSE